MSVRETCGCHYLHLLPEGRIPALLFLSKGSKAAGLLNLWAA